MTTSQIDSPVRSVAEDSPGQPAPTAELQQLYRGDLFVVPSW
jgi:hypothetical protein